MPRNSELNYKFQLSLFCVFYFHINEFYCWFLHLHEWRPPTSKLEQVVSIAYVCVHLNFCRSNLCSLLLQLQSIISNEKSCIHLILWTLAICHIWNIFVEDLAQTLLRDRTHLYMHSATPYFNIFFLNSYIICPFGLFIGYQRNLIIFTIQKNNRDMGTCQQGRGC